MFLTVYQPGEVKLMEVTSLEELHEKLQKEYMVTVRCNDDLLLEHHGTDHPMWRVAIVPDEDNKKFLLVVSMSHVLGDMVTFHRIQHMLSEDALIDKLNPQRPLRDLKGEVPGGDVFDNDVFRKWLRQYVQPKMKEANANKKGTLTACSFCLSHKWVKQQKQQALADDAGNDDSWTPTFVSTNDILVSWFFRNTDATLGLILWDFRGRLDGYGKDLAGNYSRSMAFFPADYASPLLVRKSLSISVSKSAGPRQLFSICLPRLTSSSTVATVNNLVAGNRKDLVIPDCETGCQIPLFLYGHYTLPENRLPDNIPYLYVFRLLGGPGEPRLGVNVIAASPAVVSRIETSGMVDSPISLPTLLH
jgi:hypothetical protein